MKYQYLFFDLDGTLTDPGIGITNSVMYALEKYGIEISERTSLYKFIGPPLAESFIKYYGLSEADAEKCVGFYREYFSVKGLYENAVYEGVPRMLDMLKEAGASMILATSKPAEYARQILEYFDLKQYFDFVSGSNMDGTRTAKAEVIQYALDSCGIKDTSTVVMVGDRKHDIIGAAKCNVDAVGVLYGYGDRKELEEAGAGRLAETVDELKDMLIK